MLTSQAKFKMHAKRAGFKMHARRAGGNVLFMLLIAIALLAALTVAVSRSDQGAVTLGREQSALSVDKVISFGGDLKRGVESLLRTGMSETNLSFAHRDLTGYGTPDTNPTREVFHIQGGGVAFVPVPSAMNDGSQWEFYGYSAAPAQGDSDRPELMLVLPNVMDAYCTAFNERAGLTSQPVGCVHNTANRFSGSFASAGGVNTLAAGGFTRTPVPFACVRCGTSNQIYYVLSER